MEGFELGTRGKDATEDITQIIHNLYQQQHRFQRFLGEYGDLIGDSGLELEVENEVSDHISEIADEMLEVLKYIVANDAEDIYKSLRAVKRR